MQKLPSGKRPFFLSLLIALLLILASSCSTYRTRAQGFMESQQYEQARSLWVKVLADDPSDKEAIQALTRCEREAINQRLVEMRNLRLAKSDEQALEKLWQLEKRIKNWGFVLDVDSAQFKAREVRLLWKAFEDQVKKAHHNRHPLKASYLYQRFTPLFPGSDKKQNRKLQQLEREFLGEGQKLCQQMNQASASLVYFHSLADSVCRNFQAPAPNKKVAYGRGKYRDMTLVLNVEGLSPDYRTQLRRRLQDLFHNSPWYDSRGERSLYLSFSGRYRERLKTTPVALVQSYDEYQQVQDPGSPQVWTAKHQQTQHQQQGITRKVKVSRDYHYWGTMMQQEMEIWLMGKVSFLPQIRDFSFSQSAEREGIEHSEHKPEMDLYPSHAKLLDPEQWWQEQLTVLVGKVEKQLEGEWQGKYCHKPRQGLSWAQQGDALLRCQQRPTEESRDWIAEWYQTAFGLEQGQVEELLGQI